MYFYNMYGMVLVNVVKLLEYGIIIFDSFCGGFGGCFYVLGVLGNVVIDDLVYMFYKLGV